MKLIKCILIALSFFSMTVAASLEDDFFRNPDVVAPKLSPQGQHLLYKKLVDNNYTVILAGTDFSWDTKVISFSQQSRRSISDFGWLGKEYFSVTTFDRHSGIQLLIYKVDAANSVTQVALLKQTYLFDPLLAVDDIFIAQRYKNGKAHLFTINVTDDAFEAQFRSKKSISIGPFPEGSWLLNPFGEPNVNFISKGGVTEVHVKKADSRKWQQVWRQDDQTKFIPVWFDDAKNELLVLSEQQNGYQSLSRYDVQSKTFTGEVYSLPGRDIVGIIQNPYDSSIIGYTYMLGGVLVQNYDNKLSTYTGTSEGKGDKEDNYVIHFDQDYQKIVTISQSIDSPSAYYLFDAETGKSQLIGEERPWLNQYSLGKSLVIKSTSSDGVEIESYLTMPSNSAAKDVPLLVMPHGGPLGVNDTRHFSVDVHYFVQKGYAVLTPNYRGSSGFGKKFLNSGKRQWGRLIEDDIESAVTKVIARDDIDGQKVCVFGISYGGYSALISAIRRPDLYKCAISYAGVTDIPLLFSDHNISEKDDSRRVLIDILGDPNESWDTLIEYSPVYRMNELSIPIFIAQGGRDRVVDSEHYFRLKYVLDKLGKSYESIFFENEVHGFNYIITQQALYNSIDKFMQKSFAQSEIASSL
ncbi:S9 family peptidase [Shewanella sp. SR44-4]|uniref:alpha/beta hydrolase family protein n=1 Tax=Shewanella sp. SR44-4 TaxID=2760935 RepID=UPI0015FFFA3A|nr:prolyl oligopeptidase family serine peptidase [Shewanella sp. SR44-4]MBB1361649.1 S9 family peptidase [Shewanella sp. SR44-4]